MKKLLLIVSLIWITSCNEEEEVSDYTGNQVTYDLIQSSDFPIQGTATFRERRDSNIELLIELTGTEGEIEHPAHLHYGDVSTSDAEVAKLLLPVRGTSGKSVTIFNRLNDETLITYNDMLTFDGHIKVHLDGGANKSTILASGNIGSAYTKNPSTGRKDVSDCKME
ncbi:hypothetical protein [Fulvivirga lutea]|uniref:CHRD domain-containing protein n=1 Tax=Fulvivirga lutea TaxID=2810512 RepID=A0A974WJ96_9BACT|nr:hypothetical protein [Fulvivirga lutea]QSE98959.1 hypothetical protein JR347_07710 [Fulvivirga lutea]